MGFHHFTNCPLLFLLLLFWRQTPRRVKDTNKHPKMDHDNVMQQEQLLNGFPQTVPNFTPTFSSAEEELSFHQNPRQEASAAMEIEELQYLTGFERNTPLMVNEPNLFHLPNLSFPYQDQTQNSPSFLAALGFLGDTSSNAQSGLDSNPVSFDPLFHLNLPPPPQPPLFSGLMFESPIPNGAYSMSTGLFLGEGSGGGYGLDNGIFEFNGGDKRSNGKGSNQQLNNDKQRRGQLSDKYKLLGNLVPKSSKADRASVLGDAIGYIKELVGTVKKLKMMVEMKRCRRERTKRHKTENEGSDYQEQSYNGSQSSWVQRKHNDNETDVRIVDDEVTIKFAYPQKKINCLLPVSKALDELQLDIQHVGGGLVGDNYCFLFNSKICEGYSVYASTIANKIIDVLEK